MSELVHYGVKGMHWGVRKADETGGYRLQDGGLKIDSSLHQSTKSAGTEVASLIGGRYGFNVTELRSIGPGHPEYEAGTLAYVESKSRGNPGGVINVAQGDLRKRTKDTEEIGWLGEGCGNPRAVMTHEAAHAIFHADRKRADTKARNKALKASLQEAKRDGIPVHQFSAKVSGYAATAGMREEVEAELFSQYHWSPNPPKFVKVWGETLHQELGIDGTPFKERR